MFSFCIQILPHNTKNRFGQNSQKRDFFPKETLRKEDVSLVFYTYKTNDTLHNSCESVIVGYIL